MNVGCRIAAYEFMNKYFRILSFKALFYSCTFVLIVGHFRLQKQKSNQTDRFLYVPTVKSYHKGSFPNFVTSANQFK